MTESLAARLRRQAQELLDLAETLEPSLGKKAKLRTTAVAPVAGQQLLMQKAVAIVGGQSKLAAAIGASQPQISRLRRGQRVSARMAKAIDAATGGKICHWQLRPDLWYAPQPQPEALSI